MSQTLTQDDFLGGRVRVFQPAKGYRAGTDPVLLAAACPAGAGDAVLELGCGVGVAALCLIARVPGVSVTGLEKQADYAALARENAKGKPFDVIEGDIAAMPDTLRAVSFAHVICNPPYFPGRAGTAAHDAGREMALREDLPLSAWIDAGTRRLKPGGTLTLILRADRLVDCLQALDPRLGGHVIQPLSPRMQKSAQRILVQSIKGSRAAPQLRPPLVMHRDTQHIGDGDDFTAEAAEILRGGAELSMR